nr:MAG TPA: hypothetical protein [Caudoviricetes sp.]
MPCPYDKANCMCQFCEDPCNNGLTCFECTREGEAVHEVFLCTGFTGDLDEYISNWSERMNHANE